MDKINQKHMLARIDYRQEVFDNGKLRYYFYKKNIK